MKYVYPAIFTKEEEGFSVLFPDLKNCFTQGDDLQDAYEMAEDVLCMTLYDLEESNSPIPSPSLPTRLTLTSSQFAALIGADTLEYRRFHDNRAVKKTLTIPAWLNTIAERSGINFSSVLQDALKERLNIKKDA